MSAVLSYSVDRDAWVVTIHATNPQLDESDLIQMLAELQAGNATLAELADK